MKNFNAGWYLVYTRPRHEKKVNDLLTAMNIKSFLPTRKVFRQWNDRRKYILEPLFPSYLFIYLETPNEYFQVMNIDGCLYYVKSGKEIVRVDASIIHDIQQAVDHANEMEVSHHYFQPGRRLVICEGALSGLSGEVVELDNKQKLLIRVNLLQRCILVSLPEEHLLAI